MEGHCSNLTLPPSNWGTKQKGHFVALDPLSPLENQGNMLYLFIFSKKNEFWLKQLYIVLTTIFLHMYISTSLVFMTLFKSLFRKEKGSNFLTPSPPQKSSLVKRYFQLGHLTSFFCPLPSQLGQCSSTQTFF